MFHHVVLMKFTAAALAEPTFHAEVEAWCERVRRSGPQVCRYVYKPNRAARSEGLDWAILSSFENSQAHDDYQVSPLHQDMKAFMMPRIERIVVCDLDEAL